MDSDHTTILEHQIEISGLQDIIIQKDSTIIELKKYQQEQQTVILELKQQITALKLGRAYSDKFPQPFPDVVGNFTPVRVEQ